MRLSVNGNRKKLFPLQFNYLSWTGVTLTGFLCSLVWVEIGEVPDLNTFQAMIGATIIGCFQALVLSRFFCSYLVMDFIYFNSLELDGRK